MYWKGLEPSELLNYDSCHVAFMQELPFQEGKPLSPIVEKGDGSIELLNHNHTTNNLPDHQVYMASLRNADDNCDIQVVRQLDTKLGSIRCKHSIKYIVVQCNKGMIVNYKSYKFSCASM
jgi:hypothetical protein